MFGPYAQDDEYGSRAINLMELYHNQVTRVQGPFSLLAFRNVTIKVTTSTGKSARPTHLVHYYRAAAQL